MGGSRSKSQWGHMFTYKKKKGKKDLGKIDQVSLQFFLLAGIENSHLHFDNYL